MRRTAGASLGLAAALFVLVYYAVRLRVDAAWIGDALYVVPPALAMALHLRRGFRESGRTAWFFTLIGLGAGIWAFADLLWAVAVYRGEDPARAIPGPLDVPIDTLFVGFLVPMIGAMALRPHPRPVRRDPVALVDCGLLAVGVSFAFCRLAFLPRTTAVVAPAAGLLRSMELLVLALWLVVLWRRVEDRGWRRTYGFLFLFASVYGALNFAANGAGGEMRSPGGALDLAWIAPFFFLAAAALSRGPAARPAVPGWVVVLLAGAGPLAFDLAVDRLLPQLAGRGHEAHTLLLLPVSALLAAGAALRRHLEERAAARALAEARVRSDEEVRAGRLAALSAMSASVMEDLERAMAEVVRRARDAAGALGDKGERARQQAERALSVVREASAALSLAAPGTRREISVGALLEDTIQAAVEDGLGLQVSLEGLASLPPVLGDRRALRAAFMHLVRNAAQASPGGILRITAERRGPEILLRFADDGAGVPADIRHRIFDPFFTTRRVGQGAGLGLTLVHFVARDHGGSIVVEPTERGACFALRLPVCGPRLAAGGRAHWPFAAAVMASAALATLMVVLPTPAARAAWSGVLQVGAAALAAGVLAWTALGRKGRERAFWALLASGPAVWGCVCLASLVHGLRERPLAESGAWLVIWYPLADWGWAAALLLRPDRKERSPRLTLLGIGAALGLVAYFHAYLVLLPAPFSVADDALLGQLVLARGAERIALALWAGVLALRALSAHWRGLFGRLALTLAGWAVGHSLAVYACSRPDYVSGGLTDLGWIVPFLLLAALGLGERLSRPLDGARTASEAPSPLRAAASLAALAAIPAFNVLLGSSGHPALDAVRDSATLVAVVVVGLILVVREVLAHREMAATRTLLEGTRAQLLGAERRSRLVGAMGSAVHELAGHLSGITALVRLLLSQPDLTARIRGDVSRLQTRTEMAMRIVRNLLALARRVPRSPESASVNEVVDHVVEMRRGDLAQEGIRVEASLDPQVPPIPVDAPALQQVLLGLIDNSALAMRQAGREGRVTIVTRREEGQVVVTVRDDGPGLPEKALRHISQGARAPWTEPGLGLNIAEQVAEEHGGVLAGRNRPEGGAEIEIRLPMAARSESGNAG